ncbi:UNC93-like protein MFSD11 [Ylistrum balloti]|uniref:UNC93-like protein MFSD11 n=1 Tax=Ylistrum balloti TaxID=509963 RepID=UPI002905E8FA|nr:UNC93-like protein MFSD11 [Ylistrum balloti]
MAEEGVYDVRLVNIILVGFAFMFLFTAFQTAGMSETAVLKSAREDSNGTFTGDGSISLGVIYAVFAAANWIAPPIVSVVGPKYTMFLGAILYFLFILSFLKPMTWALYTGSVLVGLGAAILWTAQGNFLTINSDSNTVSRNSGIFWALLQCSLLIGNIYSYYVLKGRENIDSSERFQLFAGLSGAALVGVLLFLTLRNRRNTDAENLINLNSSGTQSEGPLSAVKRSFHLMKSREMRLLSVAIAYTGVELTFFSGVYGFCISNNTHFGDDSKGLIGISGIFIGVGEILGGAMFGLFGKRTNKYGRDPIVVLGYVLHMVCFFLIFINMPSDSTFNHTSSESAATYLSPSSKDVAILCSFLLGFGDSSFNTQIYSILGFMFPEDSSPAFALFKFVQSVTAAVSFYYSTHLLLHWQLLILVILGTLGTWCFCLIEWSATKAFRAGYQSIG